MSEKPNKFCTCYGCFVYTEKEVAIYLDELNDFRKDEPEIQAHIESLQSKLQEAEGDRQSLAEERLEFFKEIIELKNKLQKVEAERDKHKKTCLLRWDKMKEKGIEISKQKRTITNQKALLDECERKFNDIRWLPESYPIEAIKNTAKYMANKLQEVK